MKYFKKWKQLYIHSLGTVSDPAKTTHNQFQPSRSSQSTDITWYSGKNTAVEKDTLFPGIIFVV